MQYTAHPLAYCLVLYVCVCLLVVDDWRSNICQVISSGLRDSWPFDLELQGRRSSIIFQAAETYTPEVISSYMQNARFREVKWFFQGNTADKVAKLISGRSRTVYLFANVLLKLFYFTEGDFNDSHSKKFIPGGSDGKATVCKAGDPGSIPGLGRSPGGGNGNPRQYSCLENPMDGGAWWAAVDVVAKSWTWLSDFTFTPRITPLLKTVLLSKRE